jgi:tetratricopeptide (TPR) repeat protein
MPQDKQFMEALLAFLNAPTAAEARQVIESRRELLLFEVANQVFTHLIEQYQGDQEKIRFLQDSQDLLARCRREGIDAVFAKFSAVEDLQALLTELQGLSRSRDIPRRVQVCRAALDLVDRESRLDLWAALQHELANSLAQDLIGNRAANQEQAIHHYQQALKVFTREAFPVDWAMTQNNLGNAFRERIAGERAANLEQAIQHLQQALEVYTREDFPVDWAMTQHNLGLAFSERITGERAANQEQAIHHYQQALDVFTREAFPERWAMTQNNLGRAFGQCPAPIGLAPFLDHSE